jgi:hypothetical protein
MHNIKDIYSNENCVNLGFPLKNLYNYNFTKTIRLLGDLD